MRLNLWLGIGVSAAAVAVLVYQIDFREVGDAFRAANYGWLIPAVAASLLTVILRAWRWKYLLRDDLQASFEGRLSATFIGFMANGLLPARIGEFVRAWCLGRREDKSKSAVFASVVVERLADGLWILLYLVLVLWAVPFPEGGSGGGSFLGGFPLQAGLRWAGLLSLLLYVGIIAFLVLLRRSREKAFGVLGFLLRPFSRRISDKVHQMLEGFIRGIYLPRFPYTGGLALLSTCLLWVVMLGINYMTFLAFDLNLPWHAPVFVLVMQAIGVMIPSSPGFVGTYHAAAALGVRFYGASEGVALSFAVVVHLVAFLPIVLVGLAFLWRENLSFGKLMETRGESPV